MTTNTSKADRQPANGEVYVEVSGLTGVGKSGVAGEIEIAMRALGLDVVWEDSENEKRLTHADWIGALEMYKPRVVIRERNISRAHLTNAHPESAARQEAECQSCGKPDGCSSEFRGEPWCRETYTTPHPSPAQSEGASEGGEKCNG